MTKVTKDVIGGRLTRLYINILTYLNGIFLSFLRNDDDKESKKRRKAELQQMYMDLLGLKVDQPLPGGGNR